MNFNSKTMLASVFAVTAALAVPVMALADMAAVPHGLRNPEGPDHGDLPNLYAGADGSAQAEFFTVLVSVAGGDLPSLLDEDGSAVIIHENPDDHLIQPIGGAGGRIACGIIEAM